MKILVISDIHNEMNYIEKLMRVARGINFDLIICTGDITDFFQLQTEYTQVEISDMIIKKLLTLKKPLLCIPGNHDPVDIIKLFDFYNINLHMKSREIMGMNFIGFGGATTPFNSPFEPNEMEGMKKISNLKSEGNFILVVHNPPHNSKVDRTFTGQHVGSPEIRKFIEREKPTLVLCGHIHESEGTDIIGDSIIFNPGPFFRGNIGIVNIIGKKASCEINNLDDY